MGAVQLRYVVQIAGNAPNPKKAEIFYHLYSYYSLQGMQVHLEHFSIDLSIDDHYRITTITDQCTITVKSGPAFT